MTLPPDRDVDSGEGRPVRPRELGRLDALLALQLTHATLRAILESAAEAIITADADQRILLANPGAEGMFGYSADELVGMSLAELLPERYREAHAAAVAGFGAAGHASRRMSERPDVVGLRASGEEFFLDAAISSAVVDGQRLYTAILRDVTAHRHAAAMVHEHRATLDAALASMDDALFIADHEGRVVEANEAFAAFCRFSGKADCLRTLAEYDDILDVTDADGTPVPPDRWPVMRALRGERGSGAEYWLARRDTGERWIGDHSFAPIRGPDGAVVGAVVTARDVTKAKRAVAELQATHAALELAHEDLRLLVAARETVQEDERRRIARELHDDLQQILTGVRLYLGVVAGALAEGPPPARDALEQARELVAEALVASRRIVNDLRPPLLEDFGLAAALEALAERFAARTGIDCTVVQDADPGQSLASEIENCLFRIAQEALNNVVKHAAATRVTIELRGGETIELRVIDDGVGFARDARRRPGSLGLVGMHERLRAVGGDIVIASESGRGTTVAASVSVRAAEAVAQRSVEVPRSTEAQADAIAAAATRGDLCSYAIDGADRIVRVDPGSLAFALQNGGGDLADRWLGRTIWELMAGADMKHGWRRLLSAARRTPTTIRVRYRCDSPDRRRLCELGMTADDSGSVEFLSLVIDEAERPPLALLDPAIARGSDSLVVCGWCKRAHLGHWLELERATELLGADRASHPPHLAHGICETCSAMVDAVVSGDPGRLPDTLGSLPACGPGGAPRG